MKFSNEKKQELVTQYYSGESVSVICLQNDVPRSTFYTWVTPHKVTTAPSGQSISNSEFIKMKQQNKKLAQEIEVLQQVNCTASSPLYDKLQELAKLYGQYSVHTLCDALCVSRGTFYNHIFRRKEVTVYDKRREEICEKIQFIFDESQQRFGAGKITVILANQGVRTSPKYVAELMREMGIESIVSSSKREYRKRMMLTKKQNYLQQKFHVSEPNRFWVSDVTCYKLDDRYYYICIILDLFSHKIVAYGISPKNSTYLITSTFKRAFKERGNPTQLTFHSDQGSQYTSKTMRNLLRMNKVVQSFSKPGTPYDNAVAESFFSHMKTEELYRFIYKSEREFYERVDKYMLFYNNERPHKTLSYKTPEQFELLYKEKNNNSK